MISKTFREERWFGSTDSFPAYLVRFFWDTNDGATVPHWIDFQIFSVVARTMTGVPEFYANESMELADGLTQDLTAAHPECSGFVKWDGCSQFYFAADRNEPALHFDDAESMQMFLGCLTYARARCLEVMPDAGP